MICHKLEKGLNDLLLFWQTKIYIKFSVLNISFWRIKIYKLNGEVVNLTIQRMASNCDEEFCCQQSLKLFWAQVLPKEGETQMSRERKLYLEVACSHKQRFGENAEVKVASNQTKGSKDDQPESEKLK